MRVRWRCTDRVADVLTLPRVQDLEEECPVSVRFDPEHSSGLANPHYTMVAGQAIVRHVLVDNGPLLR